MLQKQGHKHARPDRVSCAYVQGCGRAAHGLTVAPVVNRSASMTAPVSPGCDGWSMTTAVPTCEGSGGQQGQTNVGATCLLAPPPSPPQLLRRTPMRRVEGMRNTTVRMRG